MIVAAADRPDVAALIPTLGIDVDRLAAAVAAVRAQQGGHRIAVVVIVNSADPPAPGIAELGVDLAAAGANLGWAGGLTLGRRTVEAPLLWLVQDDFQPEPDCLAALEAALDADTGLALAAPVVVDESGSVPRLSCGATIGTDGDLDELIPPADTPVEAFTPERWGDYVPSRGMLVRREDWDAVGGMDPAYYPVLWADVDFCAAQTARGRRFAIARAARARHADHGSLPGALGPFLHARNRDRFLARHRPGAAARRAPDLLRPSSPAALRGVLHAAVDLALASAVAQAAADAFLHLSRVRAAEQCTVRTAVEASAEQARLNASLGARLAELDAELAAARARLDARERELAELRDSHAWRITAPLRALGGLIRGGRR
jgi:GT2 family glycosyltransferase